MIEQAGRVSGAGIMNVRSADGTAKYIPNKMKCGGCTGNTTAAVQRYIIPDTTYRLRNYYSIYKRAIKGNEDYFDNKAFTILLNFSIEIAPLR